MEFTFANTFDNFRAAFEGPAPLTLLLTSIGGKRDVEVFLLHILPSAPLVDPADFRPPL